MLVAMLVVAALAFMHLYALLALVGVVAFVVFAIANTPSRYRLHGWGQILQGRDHRVGIFGRSYPEDSMGPVRTQHVGRNDPCPCRSGEKFKRCCGAAS